MFTTIDCRGYLLDFWKVDFFREESINTMEGVNWILSLEEEGADQHHHHVQDVPPGLPVTTLMSLKLDMSVDGGLRPSNCSSGGHQNVPSPVHILDNTHQDRCVPGVGGEDPPQQEDEEEGGTWHQVVHPTDVGIQASHQYGGNRFQLCAWRGVYYQQF